MSIPLVTIILLVCAVAGIVWAYPRTPAPWNYVIVAVVVLICLFVIARAAGVNLAMS